MYVYVCLCVYVCAYVLYVCVYVYVSLCVFDHVVCVCASMYMCILHYPYFTSPCASLLCYFQKQTELFSLYHSAINLLNPTNIFK